MATETVKFDITAVDRTAAAFKSVGAGLGGLRDKAHSLVAGVGKIGIGLAALGAGAAIGGLVAVNKVMSEAVGLANVQEKAENKLAAVIKATGGAAGHSVEDLKKMASSMQEITTSGDETILNGMAVLATFKEIKGKGFEEATMAALDMSTVMEQDLKSSMVMIGKAMNDPIKGLSALSKNGVSFTEEQKKMVKELQESGDLMGAQAIIMAELKSEFGGAAAAAAQTFSGKIDQMKNAWGDLLENLGYIITKNQYFSDLADRIKIKINDWIVKINEWREANKELVAEKFEEWVGKVKDWVLRAYDAIGSFYDKTVQVVGVIREWWQENGNLIKQDFSAWYGRLEAAVGPAYSLIKDLVAQFEQWYSGVTKLDVDASIIAAWQTFADGITAVVDGLEKLGKWIGTNAAKLYTFWERLDQNMSRNMGMTVEMKGKASPERPLMETIANVQGKFKEMANQINGAQIGTTVGFSSDMSNAIFARLMELNKASAYAQAASQTQTYGAANIARGAAASASKQQAIETEGMMKILEMMGGARLGGGGSAGGGIVINVENAIGDISTYAADKIAEALRQRGYNIGNART